MDKWGKYCLAVEKQFKYDVSKIFSKEAPAGDDNVLQVMFSANVDYQQHSLSTDTVSDVLLVIIEEKVETVHVNDVLRFKCWLVSM